MAFSMTMAELLEADQFGLLGKHPAWERIPLAEIAEVLNGAAFDSSLFNAEKGMPLVRIRDVTAGQTSTYYTGGYAEHYTVETGDLLVGMDGDFNSSSWKSGQALLNQRVCKVTTDDNYYDKALLGYALPGYLTAINSNTPSVTVKHLSSRTIGKITLPLPPRAEQSRIVEKLEELLSELDAGVAELKAAQIKLTQYRQSLLKAAVEGTLTADWRRNHPHTETGADLLERILTERRTRWEEKKRAELEAKGKKPPKNWQSKYPEPVQPDITDLPELPTGWVWASVDQVAEVLLGKMLDRAKHTSGAKLSYLRNVNIRWGKIDTSDVLAMFFKDDELSRYGLCADDVLVCEGGEPGRAAIVDTQHVGYKYQKALHRVRMFGLYDPFLFVAFMEYVSKTGQLKRFLTGSTIKHFTKRNFLRLSIPVPPVDEQKELVGKLYASDLDIDSQESAVYQALKQIAAQRQNILRAAFAGELVPQDPNDEPASALLARIRAEREAPAAAKQSRSGKRKMA